MLTIYSLFSNTPIPRLEKKFEEKGYAEFKKSLTKLLTDELEPFRTKRQELLSRETYVNEILDQGERKARIIAQSTIEEVKQKLGLI
jgi:tryptophanyl-tRNA synthetase